MAKKIQGGGRFKEGNPGGPGRPQIPPEVKALRKITNEFLQEVGDLILLGDKQRLSEIAASLTEPAIKVIYAKAAVNAMTKGDVASLELILNRVVGKVKDNVVHDTSGIRIVVEDYQSKK